MATTKHDDTSDRNDDLVPGEESRRGGLLAGAGLLGALLASSCCIVPLAFVTLGIGGAWMSNLTALEPYKPYFRGRNPPDARGRVLARLHPTKAGVRGRILLRESGFGTDFQDALVDGNSHRAAGRDDQLLGPPVLLGAIMMKRTAAVLVALASIGAVGLGSPCPVQRDDGERC